MMLSDERAKKDREMPTLVLTTHPTRYLPCHDVSEERGKAREAVEPSTLTGTHVIMNGSREVYMLSEGTTLRYEYKFDASKIIVLILPIKSRRI